MIMMYDDFRSGMIQKSNKVHHVRLDRRKVNKGLPRSQNTCGDKILCCCNGEFCVQMKFSFGRFSCKNNKIIIRRIFISKVDKTIYMFVYWTFSDITSSRIWKLYKSKSVQKWCQQKNTCTYFFCKLSIHILRPHLFGIES